VDVSSIASLAEEALVLPVVIVRREVALTITVVVVLNEEGSPLRLKLLDPVRGVYIRAGHVTTCPSAASAPCQGLTTVNHVVSSSEPINLTPRCSAKAIIKIVHCLMSH